MTGVFYERLYGRFIEIQSNLRERNFIEQGSSFLRVKFSHTDNVKAPIYFSLRTASSIFTSIAPVLLDCSNKTSQVFHDYT